MTCKHSKYEKGVPVCKKDRPMQLMRCMGRGKPMPCYDERKEVREK